jgi:hypothetical protein
VYLTGWRQTLLPMEEDEDAEEGEAHAATAALQGRAPAARLTSDGSASSDEEEEELPPSASPAAISGKKTAAGSIAGARQLAQPPAKTPAKSPGGSADVALSGAEAAYEASLVAHLRANGRTSLSRLGGEVKFSSAASPVGSPRLKTFIKARPTVFRLIGDQVESVRK